MCLLLVWEAARTTIPVPKYQPNQYALLDTTDWPERIKETPLKINTRYLDKEESGWYWRYSVETSDGAEITSVEETDIIPDPQAEKKYWHLRHEKYRDQKHTLKNNEFWTEFPFDGGTAPSP